MATCLVALGSNLGDREATLRGALAAINDLPDVRLVRQSRRVPTEAVGCTTKSEFLNGAAVVETTLEPLALADALLRVEARHGRVRGERWGDRTLDLDLLIYDDLILETERLTVPHPRMSFRRFVLEPAAEIAGEMVHPVIGWSIDRLFRHLDTAADLAAIASPSEHVRTELATILTERFGAGMVASASVENATGLWPPQLTTWLQLGSEPRLKEDFSLPKLSILVDAEAAPGWAGVARQPGRGPTLHIRTVGMEEIRRDAIAAVEAVWPHLGPLGR